MKKFCLIIFGVLIVSLIFAQNEDKQVLVKKNWNFGALPAITFDSDLGFQYGGLINLYNYGDGSRYPAYNHSLYFEVSHYTKGSGIYRFYYNSDQLIKGLFTSLDISYLPDQAFDFYGYNGYESIIHTDWTDDKSDTYRTRMFYKHDRKLFRTKVDLQGKISGNKFRWIAGINFQNFKIGSVNIDKLNKGKDDADKLPPPSVVPGLYEYYKEWKIIGAEEANGGFVPTFKGGLVFDTRDNLPNPMKGIWEEAVLEASPKILGAESSFSRVCFIHRHYLTLIPRNLSFAYRLAYQTTLAGDVPFYYKSQMITSVMTGYSTEGMGGAKTIRGVLRNRVQGDGVFLGNAEFRWKFARFNWIKNNFYLGLNVFTDFGRVTRMVDVKNKIIAISSIPQPSYFNWDGEKMHYSYGGGLRVVMNENFVVAFDYGRAADKQDGDSGFYVGLNYLF